MWLKKNFLKLRVTFKFPQGSIFLSAALTQSLDIFFDLKSFFYKKPIWRGLERYKGYEQDGKLCELSLLPGF